MPQDQIINNPLAAYQTVADYQLGKDAVGAELQFGYESEKFIASATITKGQAVKTVGTGAAGTTTLRVAPVPTGGPGHLFVGVAKKGAAAGEMVEVVTKGYVLADVLNGVAVDVALTFSAATAGRMIATAANPPDATTIVGAVFGRTLAASQAPPVLTPIYVEHM